MADTYFVPADPGASARWEPSALPEPSALAESALVNSVSAMKASANTGQFGIDETGGQALVQACHHLKDWYNANANRLFLLTRQPKLGSSHMAEVLKPYVQGVATDAKDGFLPRLRELVEVLDDFEASIQQAMKNYRNNNEEQKRNIETSGAGASNDTYYV